MSEKIYYCICDDDCKYETLTKEGIIAAIAEATGYVPSGDDEAFITKIKELNNSGTLQFWKGTETEFNALGVTADENIIRIGSDGKVYLVPAGDFTLSDNSVTMAMLASDVKDTGFASLDSAGRVKPVQASSYRVNISASSTLTLSHAGRFVLVNSSSDVTITVPADSDVAWPDYTEIEFCQWGTGSVTIEGATGVGIVSLDGAKTIAGQYGCCCLKKTGGSTWILSGALA